MNIKTYFNKTNTIIYNSSVNTSQNPVCELYYGDGYTRVLLYVDTDRIQSLYADNTFADITKVKHILKMKNSWSLQSVDSKYVFASKERTSSFDLYLLRMPESWDSGSGSDFTKDGFVTNNYVLSESGSNWFNSASATEWIEGAGAIASITTGNTIAFQHFDIGNEDLEIDITDEINSIIAGDITNNGFMLCFPALLEETSSDLIQYVGFFTNNTTTFFKPYLETIYSEVITDDRNNFYLNKDNKLYFYSIINGQYENLDNLPTCTINGLEYTVNQATKGIYYAEVNLDSNDYSVGEMLYDVWSGITYNSKDFGSVEMEFVTKSQNEYFNFGNNKSEQVRYVPSIYGIKQGEKLNRGIIRKVFVNPREEYTTKVIEHITGMEYRIYVKEIDKEITVIDYDSINRTTNDNYFIINTDDLLPNKYFVDIKINKYDEEHIHKNKLQFEIVNEL